MKPATLQTRLQALRKQHGLTLDELAELTGSSKSYTWELENKPTIRPSARMIINIAVALETSVDFLMDGVIAPDADEKVLLRAYRGLPVKMQPVAIRILKCLS